MKTNSQRFICTQFLPTLVIAALMVGAIIFATSAGATSDFPATAPQISDRGGCRAWGGRRLRSTNAGVMPVQYSVGLGRISADGQTGRISLAADIITANSYTPDVLALSFFPKGPTESLANRIR